MSVQPAVPLGTRVTPFVSRSCPSERVSLLPLPCATAPGMAFVSRAGGREVFKKLKFTCDKTYLFPRRIPWRLVHPQCCAAAPRCRPQGVHWGQCRGAGQNLSCPRQRPASPRGRRSAASASSQASHTGRYFPGSVSPRLSRFSETCPSANLQTPPLHKFQEKKPFVR